MVAHAGAREGQEPHSSSSAGTGNTETLSRCPPGARRLAADGRWCRDLWSTRAAGRGRAGGRLPPPSLQAPWSHVAPPRSPSRRRPSSVALVLGVGLLLVRGRGRRTAGRGGRACWPSTSRIRHSAGCRGDRLGVASVLAGPRFRDALPPEARSRAPSRSAGVWMLRCTPSTSPSLDPLATSPSSGCCRAATESDADLVAATTWSRVLGLATIAALGLVLPWHRPRGWQGAVGALVLLGGRARSSGRWSCARISWVASRTRPSAPSLTCSRGPSGGCAGGWAARCTPSRRACRTSPRRGSRWFFGPSVGASSSSSASRSRLCAAAAVGIPLHDPWPRSMSPPSCSVAVAFAPRALGASTGCSARPCCPSRTPTRWRRRWWSCPCASCRSSRSALEPSASPRSRRVC